MENKPDLKLVSQDGNAFMIMGLARRAAKKAGWSQEKITEYMDKAMEGSYDQLLCVTRQYFNVY